MTLDKNGQPKLAPDSHARPGEVAEIVAFPGLNAERCRQLLRVIRAVKAHPGALVNGLGPTLAD